jgi:hypothetical protein
MTSGVLSENPRSSEDFRMPLLDFDHTVCYIPTS